MTVRTIGVTTYGGPEVLRAVQLPETGAGPGEVRIQVPAGGVDAVSEVVPAAAAVDAHRLLDKCGLRGRIILDMTT